MNIPESNHSILIRFRNIYRSGINLDIMCSVTISEGKPQPAYSGRCRRRSLQWYSDPSR